MNDLLAFRGCTYLPACLMYIKHLVCMNGCHTGVIVDDHLLLELVLTGQLL